MVDLGWTQLAPARQLTAQLTHEPGSKGWSAWSLVWGLPGAVPPSGGTLGTQVRVWLSVDDGSVDIINPQIALPPNFPPGFHPPPGWQPPAPPTTLPQPLTPDYGKVWLDFSKEAGTLTLEVQEFESVGSYRNITPVPGGPGPYLNTTARLRDRSSPAP